MERIDGMKEILFDFYSRDTTINDEEATRKADRLAVKLWQYVEHNQYHE